MIVANRSSPIEERIAYRFTQTALLTQALTHGSYGKPQNERLEFLGDAVLNCVIAEDLYARFAQLSEGQLSTLRANLVRQATLVEVAHELALGEVLRLGDQARSPDGYIQVSILADALEAVFGAVFLDGGYAAASTVVHHVFALRLQALTPDSLSKDAKTRLQEYLQKHKLPLPIYRVLTIEGQAHQQHFCVECDVPALKRTSRGEGHSRRVAEQHAAEAMLSDMKS